MPRKSRKTATMDKAVADIQGRPGAKAKTVTPKPVPTPYAVLYCDDCGGLSFDTPQCEFCGAKSRAAVCPLGVENHPPQALRECYGILNRPPKDDPGAEGWYGAAPFLAWDRVASTAPHYTLYFYPHKTRDVAVAHQHEWFLVATEDSAFPEGGWDVYHVEKKPPSAKGVKAEPIEWYVDTIENADDLLEVLTEMVSELTPAQIEATEAKAKASKGNVRPKLRKQTSPPRKQGFSSQ